MSDPVLAPLPDCAGAVRGAAPSISLYVMECLREDILAGVFEPGARLPFKILEMRYGVSVVPIREALSRLVGSGLVELEAQRGFRVSSITIAEFDDITANRLHLESHALRLSVARGDAAWRDRVRMAQDRYARVAEKAGEAEPLSGEWESLHRACHMSQIAACGSPMLVAFCADLSDRFDRYRRFALPSKTFTAGVSGDHAALAQAATANDGDAAAALFDRHVRETAAIVRAELACVGVPESR